MIDMISHMERKISPYLVLQRQRSQSNYTVQLLLSGRASQTRKVFQTHLFLQQKCFAPKFPIH